MNDDNIAEACVLIVVAVVGGIALGQVAGWIVTVVSAW